MAVRHTAKYVGCKFISRSLIGTIRSCAFMCVKGRKKFEHVQKLFLPLTQKPIRLLCGGYTVHT